MSERRIRVAHVIEAMHQGGAESLVVEHVRLAAPDVESWVVALNRGGPALEAAAAAGAHTLLLSKDGALAGLSRLSQWLAAERVDVVNGHNPTGGLYGALASALARVPVAIRTEHSFHYRGRHSALYPFLEVLSTWLSRRVVCVCEAVLESHIRRLPWAAGRFVSVANGISPAPHIRPRDVVRAELGLGSAAPVALTVGSLTPQKAQRVLLDAWASIASAVPGAMLLIAGEGSLRGELEARAGSLGIAPRVRFLGARLDAPDLMAAADVFVLSSVREGLSITLLEAMRAGRACVATRIGGNGEAIEDGATGLLVPPSDPGALAAALTALLRDPARAATLGAAGQRRWSERFTAERMVRATEAIYREELARAGRGAASLPTRAAEAAR